MTYPTFNSGDVLPASDLNAIGLWLVKTQTVGSGVSSVAVTGAFSADYDNYRIIYDGGSASTNAALSLSLGSTATGYHYSIVYNQYNATTPLGAGATNTTAFLNAGRSSTVGNSLTLDLFGPFLSARTGARYNSTDYLATTGFTILGGGMLDNTTSYTAFTITPASGTITGGTIRVYGYRN
jgi:hypothetical protein